MLKKRALGVLIVCLSLSLVAVHVTTAAPQSSATTQPGKLRLASGQKLSLELETPVNTTTAKAGDRVLFRTSRDIAVNGKTAIPKGSLIGGTITQVKTAQNSKRAEIEFRLDNFKFEDGTQIPLKAEPIKLKAENGGGGKAVLNGVITQGLGQAAQGAVLGGLFGGRKAAGIGAALGIGATLLSQTILQPKIAGPELDLSSGVTFEARLKDEVSIPERLANSRPAQVASNTRPRDITLDNGALDNGNLNNGQPDDLAGPIRPTREQVGRRDSVANADIDLPAAGDPAIPGRSGPSAPVPVFNDSPTTTTMAAATPGGTIPLDAPSDAAPAFKLSVNVSLAQVDTLVRDRSGRPIANLTIGDFRLFEDGVEQPIQTFSRDQLPLALALVIDRSTSVAPAMREIQSSAYTALAQLKEGDAVCLFTFADDVQMLESLTSDRQRVANRIGSIGAGGGTHIVNATYAALRYLEDTAPDRRRAVILISDNENGDNDMNIAQAIRLAHQSETVIYSVKIDPTRVILPSILGRTPSPLRIGGNPVPELTRESGGEIFDVVRLGSIEKAMATAVERLKTRYTLGYSPSTEDARDYHRIEIRLVDRFGKPDSDYTVLARTANYGVAPPNSSRPRR